MSGRAYPQLAKPLAGFESLCGRFSNFKSRRFESCRGRQWLARVRS